MTRDSTTRGKTSVVLLVLLLLAGGGAAFAYLSATEAEAPVEAEPAAEPSDGPMSEAERVAYLKDHVTLDGLKIGPDTKPGSDEVVPGLLRVDGTIRNNGPRKLERAVVSVYPKDAAGEVLGSAVEDVLKKGGGLAPGESRDFVFRIPDKAGFSGDFGHSLR